MECKVFVVDQYNPDGTFDEHKVMLGFNDEYDAKNDYLANYEKGWEDGRRIDVTAVNLEDFEKWIDSSHRKTKPFSEYKIAQESEQREFERQYNEKKNTYEKHKSEQEAGLKGLLTDLANVGISLGSNLADQTRKNIDKDGFFICNGSTTVYHGTQKLDLEVKDLEPSHKRVDGDSADFNGQGVYFTPTDDNDYGNGPDQKMLSCRLKIGKPFYVVGSLHLEDEQSRLFSEILLKHGYDAVIAYSNVYNCIEGFPTEIVALQRKVIVPLSEDASVSDKQTVTNGHGLENEDTKSDSKKPKRRGGFFNLGKSKELEPEIEQDKQSDVQEKFATEKKKFAELFGEYADVLRESDNVMEAVGKFRKMAEDARAEAKDWASRKYKKNNAKIESYDVYDDRHTTTIQEVNERRRYRTIKALEKAAAEYDEYAETLLSRCGLPKDYGLNDKSTNTSNAKTETTTAPSLETESKQVDESTDSQGDPISFQNNEERTAFIDDIINEYPLIDDEYIRNDFWIDISEWMDDHPTATEAEIRTYAKEQANDILTDSQGNPINADGTLRMEKIESVDELTDEDFSQPTRNVELPALPKNVDDVIGANGKPVVIKKNIFEKNNKSHKDLSPQQSREILSEALYSPNLYEQNQKTTRPYNWILVHNAAKHSSVILEVAHSKDNIEIVNWHYLDDATLKQKERQAIKEGGLILTLESAAGNTHDDLSSEDKGTDNSEDKQEDKTENEVERRLKIEIDKVTDTPQFGKRLTHSWQVSYNSGELTREQLLRLEKKAQKMGGSYDSDMDTFNMPTEETANQMKETIIKEAMVNDDSQRSAHENETILDKANRIADEQKKKREAKKAESEEKKPTFVIKPSTYTNKAGKND